MNDSGTSPETNGGTVMTDGRIVALGIAYGLTLAAVVATFANISGGHFNPAVSAAFFVTGNMSFLKAAAYIVAQVCMLFAAFWILHFGPNTNGGLVNLVIALLSLS